MDMIVRKILRDFIDWQGRENLLKNELTISYEVAETYLEQNKVSLNDFEEHLDDDLWVQEYNEVKKKYPSNFIGGHSSRELWSLPIDQITERK